jgi:glucosamine--fructose-6-phosphate aminotransferase (isomerizing)
MCGIFGCLVKINPTLEDIKIVKIIYDALSLLKNRGYDSCGIYLRDVENNNITLKYGVDGEIIKTSGYNDIFKLLEINIEKYNNNICNYNIGIGHTRWATHGGKTDENSHPHTSNSKKFTLVHNGIISNCEDIKKKYLSGYNFFSKTDTEVIVNLIEFLYLSKSVNSTLKSSNIILEILKEITEIMEGTWACIISSVDEPDKLFFIKNENPLLIAQNENLVIFTSEPTGFMNMVDNYILLREKTYGYIDNSGYKEIYGEYKELPLLKLNDNDITLPDNYLYWMRKEIDDQTRLSVLIDPITNQTRYNNNNILFNFDYIKKCKYLYIIACGSSYYAGLIASNYFRYTKAFELVNVFDGGEFTQAHLEAIKNPEQDLLIVLISQSGETRDLNIATTICRDYSLNRRKKLDVIDNNYEYEIKILGIINVIGSLISRRTIDNIYTNCGRENAVASTKSCTSQIMACLLLAIYKAELNNNLDNELKNKFLNDLKNLESDISLVLSLEDKIKQIASSIINDNPKSIFLLGKDELYGSALEGALKIKEIAYIHAEGFYITSLKHGPYAMLEKNTPVFILYKKRDHVVKSIIQELLTREARVIEISEYAEENEFSIKLPANKTMTGLLSVIVLQLLSYNLSILKGINPDRPRNLAKVVTVD